VKFVKGERQVNGRQLKAGVLCSEATAKSGLFTRYLERSSIPFLYPNDEDQRLLGRLILDVKAKADLHDVAANMKPVVEEMASRGADYFVLACTEIPLIAQCEPLPYLCVDATTELAKAAILDCGYGVIE
jgi:aspartate racemase